MQCYAPDPADNAHQTSGPDFGEKWGGEGQEMKRERGEEEKKGKSKGSDKKGSQYSIT